MAPFIAHDKKSDGTGIDIPLLSGVAKPVIVRVNLEKDILPVLAQMSGLLVPYI